MVSLVQVAAESYWMYPLSQPPRTALNSQFFRILGVPQMLDLRRPIYEKTAAYGHLGRDEPQFSWVRTGKAAMLCQAASIKG
jgi:S-adenosylmethionine synthetase